MKGKHKWDIVFDVEIAGGLVSIFMIAFAFAAFMDTDNTPLYFTIIIGSGSILNCILAILQFRKKSYVLGCLLAALCAALFLLFVIQILLLKG